MQILMWQQLVLLCVLVNLCQATTRCVKVTGQVSCPRFKSKEANARIMLFDEDNFLWETDDEMGRAWTDVVGKFAIEGCGDDFGPWNEPDPYLHFVHRCPQNGVDVGERTTTIELPKMFLPATIDVGEIRLDVASSL